MILWWSAGLSAKRLSALLIDTKPPESHSRRNSRTAIGSHGAKHPREFVTD